ncbi:MAG TPA: hypothetical protein VFO29_08580 [Candidatus Rubrimentiphilum sp.]|nr:hypothetical protein [Candidatus Rubrimentiphilum sp.]
MTTLKIAVAALLLALSSPVLVFAEGNVQSTTAIQSAALGSLTQPDRALVRNILGLLSTGQIDTITAVAQIDAVLSDSEVKSVLAVAKKTASDAEDAGQFLVDLAQRSAK